MHAARPRAALSGALVRERLHLHAAVCEPIRRDPRVERAPSAALQRATTLRPRRAARGLPLWGNPCRTSAPDLVNAWPGTSPTLRGTAGGRHGQPARWRAAGSPVRAGWWGWVRRNTEPWHAAGLAALRPLKALEGARFLCAVRRGLCAMRPRGGRPACAAGGSRAARARRAANTSECGNAPVRKRFRAVAGVDLRRRWPPLRRLLRRRTAEPLSASRSLRRSSCAGGGATGGACAVPAQMWASRVSA